MKKRISRKEDYEKLSAACEPFRKAKTETIHTLARIGRKHRLLRYPILIMLVVYIFLYNVILYGCIQMKMRERLARCVALVMTIALVFTSVDFTVFAAMRNGDGTNKQGVIVAFAGLEDSIASQSLSVGAEECEISFPSTLVVTMETEREEELPEENTTEPEEGTEQPEEGTTEPEEGAEPEETTTDTPEDAPSGTSEDTSSDILLPEPLVVHAAELDETGNIVDEEGNSVSETETPIDETETSEETEAYTEASIEVTWNLNIAESTSDTFDSATVGNRYVYVPVIPEEYTVAEGVSLPQITVTIYEAAGGGELADGGAVELLMRPYDEETSSDTVYYLADSYESYSWEIWNGWEWETLEYFEPELVAGKEEWYAYRFRCVVAKDGVRYTANAADDWQIENSGIMLMAENSFSATNSAESGQSAYMFYDNAWSGYYFNVKGMDGDTVIQTTYSDRGYRTASAVTDGGKVDWNSAGETAMGNSLYGTRNISLVYNGRYAKITYTVENRGSVSQSFQVGSSADVMIGNNDYAPVVGSANGLTMTGSPKNSYTFNLVAPAADTLWYGYYGKAYSNMFTDLADKDTPYSGDSGMAWSWSDSVAPGQTWSRYVLVGVGELPASPSAPQMANEGSIVLCPGTTTTITGTADAGSTVSIEVGGEEFSGQTDENGNFSVPVTPPENMPEGETGLNYWAVSADGGISDVQTITATVVSAPFITLTDSAASVTEDDVLDEAWYKGFIKTSSGTVSHTAITTGTPGTYEVIYTAAREGYDNATVTLTVTVLPLPLALSEITAICVDSTDSFTLSATLQYPGGEGILETGFVWGIMQNPTVAMNNGSEKTSPVVTAKNGSLSVTAQDIADGVTYYARAYVKTADGNVYYSPQKDFSINGKSYGSFTISNNGDNTFTVTRTGGMDGAQTVYFRTVNGSAVGETHFTHQAGTLTFSGDKTSEIITVTEQGANVAYSGKPATAYINTNRTYSVEIYRVDGGGTLGGTTSATRSMTLNDNYKVDRNCYVKKEGDSINKQDNCLINSEVNSPSFTTAFTMDRFYTKYVPYLKETAYKYEMHLNAHVGEFEDSWEWLRFTSGSETATIKFEIKPNENLNGWKNGWFPRLQGETENDIKHTEITGMTPYNSTLGLGPVFGFDINTSSIKVEAAVTGSDNNNWTLGGCHQESVYSDIKEPQLLAIAPMGDSTYKPGDKATISLIFDEIVDSTNSKNAGLDSTSAITTSWGTFTYAGGADTNVLYFTGTVSEAAGGSVSVTSLDCADQIKDMCGTAGTPAGGSSESVSAAVDNMVPMVSIDNPSVKNGTATAVITATNANTLQYTWSRSNTMPVTGWLTGMSGESVSTRQTSGTWYLHVLGTYNATGKTAHTYTSFNFESGASGSMPELILSANNSTWAQSRTITLSKTPSDAAVTVKTPSGASVSVSGTSYTAEENGSYTFTLSEGEEMVVKSITVSKIDKTAPAAAITGPSSPAQNENVTLTITPTDAGGSGVKTVTGTWTTTTNDQNDSTMPATLTPNSDGTYSATTPGIEVNTYTYKLTLTVTDNAGNTGSAASGIYAVNLKVPTVIVTNTSSSGTGDTYSYTVNANDNTITAIRLPDGTITTDLTGTFTLTSQGTYYVTVSDAAGHVVRSSAMTVTAGVDGDAPDVRLYQQDEDWTKGMVQLDVSIYEEGGITSAVWNKEDSSLSTDVTYSEKEASVYSGAFSVTENGTYTVTVTDRSNNVGMASITVSNIDKTAPLIGALQYSYQPKNFWHWLIGKDSLIITVPVKEEGSGADEITYTVTQESGFASTQNAGIEDGFAKITLSSDFRGTIAITCTDNAGNTSDSVTVGVDLDADAKGLLIEDNAPKITFGQYTAASGITITVEDDDDNAISAGLAFVTYQIGDGEKVNVQENFADNLRTGVCFKIEPEQIPPGVTEITVQVVDNAGNKAEKTVTIEKHTVTYDYGTNGGTSAAKHSDGVLPGEGIDLTPTAEKDGWEFVGWNTDKDARTGVASLKMENGDVTLYAIFCKTLTLTCYSGSAGGTQTETVTIYNNATEGSLTIPAAEAWAASDESYDFYAYAVNPDEFDGTQYSTGSTISISEDTSLYALYKKAIQISYDANGGSGSVAGQTVYKSANVADTVTYQTDSFTLQEGTGYSRTGYNFSGWIEGSGTGTVMAAGTSVTPTGDTTYYAGWTEADYTITLHTNGGSGGTDLTTYTYGTGAALPADWTKTGYTFGGWYDNEECIGTAVTEISTTTTGNKEYWAKWVDDIAPAIGTLTYNYEPKSLRQWLIGKDSLIIKVPVTEEGSGADEITYTVTPESGFAEDKTAKIENGLAEITVSADFKGTIAITCTDKAGNTSPGVTVGAGIVGTGILIEDNAPEITFLADGSVPSSEYLAAPEITVTVTDDKDNAISAGLASVAYQIGDGVENALQEDFAAGMKNEVSFTIAADQIPSGNVEIIVKATDNAGNRTEQKLTIHVHSGTLVEAKAATCTENGHSVYYICSCGKWFSDSTCTIEITAQDVTIPAKGHTAVTDPAKAATCTETGLSEGSHCSVCGHVIKAQTVTAALGHDYGGDYHYDAGGHWKVCLRCDVEDTKHSHVYDNDRDAICNDCGYERTVKNPDTEEPEESEPETPKPTEPPEPPGEADLPEQPQPVEPSEDKLETIPDTPDDRQPEKESVQTIPAVTDNGKMTTSGEPVATGNVEGMADTSTALNLGDGAVIVTVVCEEQEYTAGVADTVAVANAVLTPEQIQLVADGETIEIRIDVKDISGNVPEQDKDVIENGIEEYRKELPELTLGMYVDISMFVKIGAGDWNAVTKAEEPIEVVIGIPQELQSDDREFYIIRSHEGEYTLLTDMDNEPDTITISTDMFSAYAIAYEQAEGTGESHKCGLCHICPTFLGICYFVWLAIIILITIVVTILLQRKKEEQDAQDTEK